MFGCSRILGVPFDEYREASEDGAVIPQIECVPGSTSRCLCELREGVRQCDDSGRLAPCVCGGSPANGCGNGVIDPAEACDDQNLLAGDGCSATCVPDGRPPVVEQCPGQTVVLWPGVLAVFDVQGSMRSNDGGSDAGAANDAGGTADSGAPATTCGVAPKPDRVYALLPNVDGDLKVVTNASTPTLVSLRTTCADPGSAASCASAAPGAPAVQHIPVTAGTPVHLIVEPSVADPNAVFSFQVSVE